MALRLSAVSAIPIDCRPTEPRQTVEGYMQWIAVYHMILVVGVNTWVAFGIPSFNGLFLIGAHNKEALTCQVLFLNKEYGKDLAAWYNDYVDCIICSHNLTQLSFTDI